MFLIDRQRPAFEVSASLFSCSSKPSRSSRCAWSLQDDALCSHDSTDCRSAEGRRINWTMIKRNSGPKTQPRRSRETRQAKATRKKAYKPCQRNSYTVGHLPSHACRQTSPSCKRHKALSCALAWVSKDSRDPAVVVPARRSLESSIEKARPQQVSGRTVKYKEATPCCASPASRTVPARLQETRTLFEAQKSFLTQAVVLRSWYARGCADQKGRDRLCHGLISPSADPKFSSIGW